MTVYEMEQKMPVVELLQWFEYHRPEETAPAEDILAAFGLK